MQKPLVVAVFSTSLAIAIVVGCSAPSPDGTSLNRGRGSSSGDDDEEEAPSASSSSGSTADCTNHAKVDDRPACDQCARAKCCEQVLECDKTPDCEAMIKCLDECAGDLACGLTCQIAHEKGGGVLQDVAACASTKCESECPSSVPDAGDFDAF